MNIPGNTIVRLNGIEYGSESSMDKQTFIQQAQMLGLVTRDNAYARDVMAVDPEHNYKQGYPVLRWSEESCKLLQFTPDNREMFRDCLLPPQDMNVAHAWAQANGFPYPWYATGKNRFHRRHENGSYSCVIQRSNGSWGYARQNGTCSTAVGLNTLAEARDACLTQPTPEQHKTAKPLSFYSDLFDHKSNTIPDFTVTVIPLLTPKPLPKISVDMGYKCSACGFLCTHENELRQWNDSERVCKDERGCRSRLMHLVRGLRESHKTAGEVIPQLRKDIGLLEQKNANQKALLESQQELIDSQRMAIRKLDEERANIENHPRMQAMRDALEGMTKQRNQLLDKLACVRDGLRCALRDAQ